MIFTHLKHLASWETIKTIKACGCMKLFKASSKVQGEVTCFLIPPASFAYTRRPDQTEYVEVISNFAVISKVSLPPALTPAPHARLSRLTRGVRVRVRSTGYHA